MNNNQEPKTNEMLSISKRQYAVLSAVKDHATGQVKSMSIKDLVNDAAMQTTNIIENQQGDVYYDCIAYPSVTVEKCNKMLLPCEQIRLFKLKDKQLLSRWETANEPIKQKWVALTDDAPIKEIDLTGDKGDQNILFGQIMDYVLHFGFKRAEGSVQLKVRQKGTDLQDGDILYFMVATIQYPATYNGYVWVTFTEVHIDVTHNTYYVTDTGRSIQFEEHQIDLTYDEHSRER